MRRLTVLAVFFAAMLQSNPLAGSTLSDSDSISLSFSIAVIAAEEKAYELSYANPVFFGEMKNSDFEKFMNKRYLHVKSENIKRFNDIMESVENASSIDENHKKVVKDILAKAYDTQVSRRCWRAQDSVWMAYSFGMMTTAISTKVIFSKNGMRDYRTKKFEEDVISSFKDRELFPLAKKYYKESMIPALDSLKTSR